MFTLRSTKYFVRPSIFQFSIFIPKEKSYYEILNVKNTATPDEIKAAYRELAKQYHPDVNISGENHMPNADKFREIAEAYAILSVPETRTNYDLNNNKIPESIYMTERDKLMA